MPEAVVDFGSHVQTNVLQNELLKHISQFQNVGCYCTHGHDGGYANKTNQTADRILGNRAGFDVQDGLDNTLTLPVVLQGSKTWSTTKIKEDKVQTRKPI